MDALRYVGCPVGPHSYNRFNPEWGWNIVTAANALHPLRTDFTKASFWGSIKRYFWAGVPKSLECDKLLGICARFVGKENVCILSSPTLDPDCLAGKLEWIKANMPKWMHRQYLIGPCKKFCARPDAVLIDDREKNVDEFRASGGHAIMMPRPWNSLHYQRYNMGVYVYDKLRRLFDLESL